MNLYIFKFKAIGITYFMFFSIVSIAISYLLLRLTYKDYNVEKKSIEDMFFSLIFAGFIGARLSYVLLNYNMYKEDLLSIISINHFNLYLFGGIFAVILTIKYYSKKYEMNYGKLLSLISTPFYFSISIGIWALYFDSFIKTTIDKSIVFLLLSLTFILGIVLETILNKQQKAHISVINLFLVISFYYIIKTFLM